MTEYISDNHEVKQEDNTKKLKNNKPLEDIVALKSAPKKSA